MMNIAKWIEQFLKSDPPRAKSVIITVFGDSIAPHGGEVWLSSLIELLAPFGINDRLVRTSVYRLTEEGWLEARRDGRRSAYHLTPSGNRRFERAHRRIYAHSQLSWDQSWTLLIVPPLVPAAARTLLRKELLWEGFGIVGTSVFFHPSPDTEALDEILGRLSMREKVFVVTATDTEKFSTPLLKSLIQTSWDLGPVVTGYRNFIRRFSDLSKLLNTSCSDEEMFVVRTLLIHTFRRIMLHDPNLPVELLSADWAGVQTYELCKELYKNTYQRAEEYLISKLAGPDLNHLKASLYFFERFEGLTSH